MGEGEGGVGEKDERFGGKIRKLREEGEGKGEGGQRGEEKRGRAGRGRVRERVGRTGEQDEEFEVGGEEEKKGVEKKKYN